MDWGTLGAMAAILLGIVGVQSFWITRELDSIGAKFDKVDARFDRVDARFDKVEASLDRIENTLLVALDRRVTRLEERL